MINNDPLVEKEVEGGDSDEKGRDSGGGTENNIKMEMYERNFWRSLSVNSDPPMYGADIPGTLSLSISLSLLHNLSLSHNSFLLSLSLTRSLTLSLTHTHSLC